VEGVVNFIEMNFDVRDAGIRLVVDGLLSSHLFLVLSHFGRRGGGHDAM
jgi:hypothetical protein